MNGKDTLTDGVWNITNHLRVYLSINIKMMEHFSCLKLLLAYKEPQSILSNISAFKEYRMGNYEHQTGYTVG